MINTLRRWQLQVDGLIKASGLLVAWLAPSWTLISVLVGLAFPWLFQLHWHTLFQQQAARYKARQSRKKAARKEKKHPQQAHPERPEDTDPHAAVPADCADPSALHAPASIHAPSNAAADHPEPAIQNDKDNDNQPDAKSRTADAFLEDSLHNALELVSQQDTPDPALHVLHAAHQQALKDTVAPVREETADDTR